MLLLLEALWMLSRQQAEQFHPTTPISTPPPPTPPPTSSSSKMGTRS